MSLISHQAEMGLRRLADKGNSGDRDGNGGGNGDGGVAAVEAVGGKELANANS